MADSAVGEELAQCAVVGVRPGAVGHDPADIDAAVGKVGQGALKERDDGVGLLVAQELAVGQTGVVVDHGVEVVMSQRLALVIAGL